MSKITRTRRKPIEQKFTVNGMGRAHAWLVGRQEDAPLAEVRKQIRIEIEMMLNSHRESDGRIRDKHPLFEISCLRKALQLLPKK